MRQISLSVLFSAPGQLAWARDAEGILGSWAPKGSIDFTWRPGLLQYVTISQARNRPFRLSRPDA